MENFVNPHTFVESVEEIYHNYGLRCSIRIDIEPNKNHGILVSEFKIFVNQIQVNPKLERAASVSMSIVWNTHCALVRGTV